MLSGFLTSRWECSEIFRRGAIPWAGRSPVPIPVPSAELGLPWQGGLWLTGNGSPCPCLNKSVTARITGQNILWNLWKTSSESQFYGKSVAVSLSAPLCPFPHPGFESASLCERRETFPKQFVLFSKQNQK